MKTEFNGETIVIIGCSRGIGRTIAARFASLGAQLMLIDNNPDAQFVVEEVESIGGVATLHLIDLDNVDQISKKLRDAIGVKKILGVVYVTGVRSKKSFDDFEPSDWDAVINPSLKGVVFAVKALLPNLVRLNAFVVTISSVAANYVGGECVAYHCAKAGIEQLTRYLAVKLGARGVRVNSVRPGMIIKDEHLEFFNSSQNEKYRCLSERVHPIGCVGYNDDVVEAVLFLASTKSKFVTGQVLVVDGGLTIQDQFDVAYRFNGSPL